MYSPDEKTLKEEILQKAYESKFVLHLGSTKIHRYLKDYYWWPNIKREIAECGVKYRLRQQVKTEHQKLVGPLQSLLIPEWKWKNIIMDFVSRFSRGKKGNIVIQVIVDELTKFTLFLPMNTTDPVDKLVRLYMNKLVRLHEVPVSIVFYHGPRFTSHLWPNIQDALGTTLSLSIAFHPKTDGQLERTIQTLKDLLRAFVLEFGDNWENHLRTLLCQEEIEDKEVIILELTQITTEKVMIIKERMKVAQDRHKSYADNRQRSLEFDVRDKLFLKIA